MKSKHLKKNAIEGYIKTAVVKSYPCQIIADRFWQQC